jgi:hypothetical protein
VSTYVAAPLCANSRVGKEREGFVKGPERPNEAQPIDIAVPKNAQRGETAMIYSIRVRRKTGEWQTELTIRYGYAPKRGTLIEATLHDETFKARVTNTRRNPSRAKGEPAVEVHAEEI